MFKSKKVVVAILSVALTVGVSAFLSYSAKEDEKQAQLVEKAMLEARNKLARMQFVEESRRWASKAFLAVVMNGTVANTLEANRKQLDAKTGVVSVKSSRELELEKKLVDQNRKVLGGIKNLSTRQLYSYLEHDANRRSDFLEDLSDVDEYSEKPFNATTWVFQTSKGKSVYVVSENGQYRISVIQ